MEALPAGEVHVWVVRLAASQRPERLQVCAAMLSASECERAARFRFERHRRAWIVAHALLRSALSHYAPVEPRAWEFEAERHGRPRIAGPSGAPPLRFNLSHTDRLAACAVATDLDVGVDVESASRLRHPLEIAERYFDSRETRELRALTRDERTDRFLDLWTLKEAYVKARGEGLSIGLDRMRFILEEAGPRVVFDPKLGDDPDHWQFELHEPAAGLRLALAVHRPRRADLAIRLRRGAPDFS
jgi:4'-phosphopantetheinyl transferase